MNTKRYKLIDLLRHAVISSLFISPLSFACYTDPLIIDLSRGGLNLGESGDGVYFDFMGFGAPVLTQWVRPGKAHAFLVRDFNQNGIVDNGQELFGDNIKLQDGSGMARNGFVALAQFDWPLLGGNGDGKITSEDSIWHELRLWIDENADGISTEDEMFTLDEMGIKEIYIIPRELNAYDEAGNRIILWGWVTGEVVDEKGRVKKVRYKMYDVVFRLLEAGS